MKKISELAPAVKSYDIIQQFEDNRDLRFVKIKKETKRPYETEWQLNGYTWADIQNHRKSEYNYGVMCGAGNLIIIDCDKSELADHILNTLPETMTVRSGSGGTHFYYYCAIEKKIILNSTLGGEKVHWGEVQARGAQCVGPGSIHPSKNIYEIIIDKPIQKIGSEELMVSISSYIDEPRVENIVAVPGNFSGDDINSLSITNVIPLAGFKKAKNGEYYGSNPWHGSTGGMNFWVSSSKNVAKCWRCDVGISVAKAIALNEGIIKNCTDEVRGTVFKKVLQVAEEKYGFVRKKEDAAKIANEKFISDLTKKGIKVDEIVTWDTIQEIDKIVVYRGGEQIYEIHFRGKIIKLEGKEVLDANAFRLRYFEATDHMLPYYKNMNQDFSALMEKWMQTKKDEVEDQREESNEVTDSIELVVNYINNCSVTDSLIFQEGVISLKKYGEREVIYIPTKVLKNLLNRNNLKVTMKRLAYVMKDYLITASVPLFIDSNKKKKERFWRLDSSKFELQKSSLIHYNEESDDNEESDERPWPDAQ